jgi:hypothetical protein
MGVVNLHGMTIVAVTKSLYRDYNVILTMDDWPRAFWMHNREGI